MDPVVKPRGDGVWVEGGGCILSNVMPGLDPGIHAAGVAASREASGMDPVVKPRGDG